MKEKCKPECEQVKFNGGDPLCLKCGHYQLEQTRLIFNAELKDEKFTLKNLKSKDSKEKL